MPVLIVNPGRCAIQAKMDGRIAEIWTKVGNQIDAKNLLEFYRSQEVGCRTGTIESAKPSLRFGACSAEQKLRCFTRGSISMFDDNGLV